MTSDILIKYFTTTTNNFILTIAKEDASNYSTLLSHQSKMCCHPKLSLLNINFHVSNNDIQIMTWGLCLNFYVYSFIGENDGARLANDKASATFIISKFLTHLFNYDDRTDCACLEAKL